jgi:NTP pyrophosphatase (non-canonical NTP hydrolase)
VDAFADEMEARLADNRDKGDREGWRHELPTDLLGKLLRETGELTESIGSLMIAENDRAAYDDHDCEVWAASIRSECADVANFAMMIADVAGGMKARKERSDA